MFTNSIASCHWHARIRRRRPFCILDGTSRILAAVGCWTLLLTAPPWKSLCRRLFMHWVQIDNKHRMLKTTLRQGSKLTSANISAFVRTVRVTHRLISNQSHLQSVSAGFLSDSRRIHCTSGCILSVSDTYTLKLQILTTAGHICMFSLFWFGSLYTANIHNFCSAQYNQSNWV